MLGRRGAEAPGLAGLRNRPAVDDHGTGHASLSYLSRLPVTALQIDCSFDSTTELDRADQAIMRSTAHLARELGLRVVAAVERAVVGPAPATISRADRAG